MYRRQQEEKNGRMRKKKKPVLSSLWEKGQGSAGESFCHLSTQGNVAFLSTNLWVRLERTGVYFDFFFK